MIVHFLHADDVLCRDHGSLSSSFVGNNSAEMNDAAVYNDAKFKWTPVILLNGRNDAVANMVIVRGRIGNLSGKSCDSLQ